MSVAEELLKKMGRDRVTIIVTSHEKSLLLDFAARLGQAINEDNLVEGSNYDQVKNYLIRRDPPHGGQGQYHYHVKDRNGPELLSINMDGSGHDGYHGTMIPRHVYKYLQNHGVNVSPNRVVEGAFEEDGICYGAILSLSVSNLLLLD